MEIEWTEDLETGIGIVDDQHRELFGRIRHFFAAADRRDPDVTLQTVDYLAEYVIEHFNAEEAIMIKHSYEGFPAHRDQHSGFIKNIYRVKQTIVSEGLSDELIQKLRCDLIDWLVNHIQVSDKQLADIQQKEVSRYKW
ncbi:bacteriohemerythrin [Aneurinibacillus sp. UBA3580]|jgi:hemerythrin|uniref:bacteriohemerythrin n=1 Tax=Aneurinibacillus sp. UBA3580 TaxID=1946041 RepID=UPI00257C1242|nr:bacteriohemerythrin [Aneurinibacillus sp. UBA3580]